MALYPARWIFVRTSHNVSSRQVRQDCNERCERMYVTKTGTWNNIVKIIVSVLIDRETSINPYIYWYFHDILSLLYNIYELLLLCMEEKIIYISNNDYIFYPLLLFIFKKFHQYTVINKLIICKFLYIFYLYLILMQVYSKKNLLDIDLLDCYLFIFIS